jgi:hypothetical protein
VSGYGSGSGDGYGNGYGYGDGDGFGYGYGDGYGNGNGNGDGYGNGNGNGYGYGYGNGNGNGYGYGDGEVVAIVAGDEVKSHGMGVYSVGCQVHHMDHWRGQWREIAEEHDIEIDEAEAIAVLSLMQPNEAIAQGDA